MAFDHRTQRATTSGAAAGHSEPMPGKRTLTEGLAVQRRELAAELARGPTASPPTPLPIPAGSGTQPTLQMLFGAPRAATAAAGESAEVHAAAARGTTAAATQLPHADQIQRAFGRHDISGIQAHTGPEAATSAREMGAQAYATGDHVVLGDGADLHTAAHEAAHVVQQRGGVQLKGGVGETGDAYERHADAVADRVVRGESAEALLDEHAGAARGGERPAGGGAIQRKPSDFAKAFGGHPQMKLPIDKQILRPGWNAYVLNVKPYFEIDDKARDKQASRLHVVASRERPLREDAVKESAKKKEAQDQDKAFSPDQLELAGRIAVQLEREKEELFGASIGQLNTRAVVPSYRVEDTQIKNGDQPYVGHEDPSQWFDVNKLFTRMPSIDDVQQGNLGDCYLLAAVASVVHRNPAHFVQHMRDNVDGTVTVRFYSAAGTPLHITIDKTVVGNQSARNVLWVKLLEKAYVASGLRTKTVGNGGDRAYKDISGGASEEALLHLTGRPAEVFGLGKARKQFQVVAPALAMEAVEPIRKQLAELEDKQAKVRKAIEEKQTKEPKADVSKEKEEDEQLAKEITTLAQQWRDVEAPRQELEDLLSRVYISQRTYEQFLKKHGDNEVLRKIVDKVGLKEGSLPGELGSGTYGNDEQAAFLKIRAAIDGRKPITASTKISIADPDNPREPEKGLAGEFKVSGLASKHAYSVLDYNPRAEERRPGQPIMIKLRNPWGSYGRKYEMVQGKLKGVADNDGKGIFWIDLADLVAYFDTLAIST